MDIVVIGGGAAGLKAATRARRRNEEASITVVDAGKYPSLGRCGLPYYVGGIVNELNDLRKTTYGAVRDEEYFKKLFNIEVLTETRAKKIDRGRRTVLIEKDGKEDELPYDYLVIATGARPSIPPIPNIDAEGVTTLTDPESAEKILEMWMEGDVSNAVIIGGGLIGLETAEALRMLDLKVTLIEALPNVLPALLDQEMAMLVERHLTEKGIRVLTNTLVREIVAEDRVRAVKTDKEEIPADIVIVATGVKPNVELAKDCGLKIGETGAIKVNEFMQTSDERIFAGGDCVENINLITGKPVYTPLGDIANKHGRVIGDNVTGGKSKFPGVIGTSIAKVFDFTIARTGLTEREARSLGYDAVGVLAPAFDRAHYFPQANTIRLKLIFDRKTLRVLGAQGVGLGVIDKRIDVIATAIQAGMTIDDLANLDLAYAPPYSPAIDPVITAAYVSRNLYDGLFEAVDVNYVKERLNRDDVVILDLRSENETRLLKIEAKNVLNIPLPELRERISEIPKDKEIITVCPLGLRAYNAASILKNMGYKVKVMMGGLTFW
uniref:FAD-binding protein n=1 Tax=Geoglobus ahangari TaxID=113653 RepID=A0A7C3YF17_9EURY